MRLESERLVIRDLRIGDAEALHAYLSDAEVMRHIEPPFSMELTREFLENAGLREKPLVYAAETRDGGVVGHVIFHPFGDGSWEIGWILRKDCWGQGLASEATRLLIDEARRRGIGALTLECENGQTASRAIARKFGFAEAGEEDGLLVFRKKMRGKIGALRLGRSDLRFGGYAMAISRRAGWVSVSLGRVRRRTPSRYSPVISSSRTPSRRKLRFALTRVRSRQR